ncbi:MAG TPA: hypothetical protein VF190_07410, partial [Rhodothermales bacterium]
ASLTVDTASAQMQTLVSGDVRHGGYGGPLVQATWLDGEPAVMVGGSGAWLINGTFAIGGAGIGLATVHRVDGFEGSPRPTLEGGYGGVTLEYINRPASLMHLSAGALIGAGGMAVMEGPRASEDRESLDETAFFVTRPHVAATLNVTDFFQISAMAAYRLVVGSTLDAYDDAALSGAELGIGLRFGSF